MVFARSHIGERDFWLDSGPVGRVREMGETQRAFPCVSPLLSPDGWCCVEIHASNPERDPTRNVSLFIIYQQQSWGIRTNKIHLSITAMLLVWLTSRDQSGEIDCWVACKTGKGGSFKNPGQCFRTGRYCTIGGSALSATVFDCVTHAQGSRLCYILPSFVSNVLSPSSFTGVFCLIYSIKEKQRATGQDRIFHSCLYCKSLCGTLQFLGKGT